MKISKLFHWLYATLMFLPFIFLLPTLAYYGFNEHATNSETTTINYKYQSNEVNSIDDLIEGNIYHFSINNGIFGEYFLFNSNTSTFSADFINISSYDFSNLTNSLNDIMPNSYENNGLISINFDFYTNYWNINIYLTKNEVNDYFVSFSTEDITEQFTLVGDFIYLYGEDISFDSLCISESTYNVIESVEVNTDNTITGQVSRAWDSVWNLPLFSWTHTSFVSEPFTYITGLFGMSADNPFNYVVTYFVSISVCWLVFDFLMYVPNLAHRWLDKGALE